MGKINIVFNGKSYSIDKSLLDGVIAELGTALSVLSGEEPEVTPSVGLAYTLKYNGTEYEVSGIGDCIDADIVVPSEYEGLPVTAVASSAFASKSNITSVTIPESVTSVGRYAFQYSRNLKSVKILNKNCSLGQKLFVECVSLETLVMPKGNNYFANYFGTDKVYGSEWFEVRVYDQSNRTWITYYLPTSLRSITFTNGAIAYEEFENYGNVQEFIFQDGVIFDEDGSIFGTGEDYESCFQGCNELTYVRLSNTMTKVHMEDFDFCPKLKTIYLPESIEEIDNYAINYCESLTDIIYAGTVAQWNAISKGTNWISNVPATYVQCSDGQVAI